MINFLSKVLNSLLLFYQSKKRPKKLRLRQCNLGDCNKGDKIYTTQSYGFLTRYEVAEVHLPSRVGVYIAYTLWNTKMRLSLPRNTKVWRVVNA